MGKLPLRNSSVLWVFRWFLLALCDVITISAIAPHEITCRALLSLVKNEQQELCAPSDLMQGDLCCTTCSNAEAPAEAQVAKAALCGGSEQVGDVIYPAEKLVCSCLGYIQNLLQRTVPCQEDTFLQLNCNIIFLRH